MTRKELQLAYSAILGFFICTVSHIYLMYFHRGKEEYLKHLATHSKTTYVDQ